jgi:hypothetical protein
LCAAPYRPATDDVDRLIYIKRNNGGARSEKLDMYQIPAGGR